MPIQLSKENVYKYCKQTTQISIYCCQAYTLFEKSFRKIRQVYLTDHAIYIISRKKLKVKIPLESISRAYVGILAGEFFLVTDKNNLIVDCPEARSKFIQNIKISSPDCQVEYVNYTTLDFLFEKHKKISTKVKLTEYDENQKKVQLKYFSGQKMDLRNLKKKWQQKAMQQPKEQSSQKDYEFIHVMSTNTYWTIFIAKNKKNSQQCIIKIYSKKFIGMQQALLACIWNQRNNLEHLTTNFTPSLIKTFCSKSNIYLVCEYYNGYLLQVFKNIKKHKIVNLIAQIVIAIGQVHEGGLIYGNVSKNGIMILLDGFVFLFNMALAIKREKQTTPQIYLKPPEYFESRNAQFGWDWWNLGQLIFQLIEKKPFYEEKVTPLQIDQYLNEKQDKLPEGIKLQKWQKDQNLLNLFQSLIKRKPQQRLGYKNDYHEILHHKYFQQWLKIHPKTQIMKKSCPPVFKKVQKPTINKEAKDLLAQQANDDQDWSEMNSYLVGFEWMRDLQ